MMNKTSLLALALIGLFLNSCANTPIKAADENFESLGISAFRSNDRVITLPDSDRTPANQNLPRWELSGLGNDYSNTGKPEQKCLQTYIETVAKPFIKTGKPDPSKATRRATRGEGQLVH